MALLDILTAITAQLSLKFDLSTLSLFNDKGESIGEPISVEKDELPQEGEVIVRQVDGKPEFFLVIRSAHRLVGTRLGRMAFAKQITQAQAQERIGLNRPALD